MVKKKKDKLVGILFLVVLLITSAGVAQAAPYTVNSGWATFGWDGAVVTPWDTTFDFTLTTPAILKVTDAYFDGDRFNVTDNAKFIGDTSVPVDNGASIGSDYDGAFADPRWSSRQWVLFPGAHSITGTVIAETTGYTSGAGAIRVDSATNCIGSICYLNSSGAGWHNSQCVVYVPGMMGSLVVGQVTYSGCTVPCPKSFCLVLSPAFP
jgi:hypothetical protein